MGFIKEFKEFAIRGSVVDLAIGLIIGTAFGKIVTSLVGDIVMPFVALISNKGFAGLKTVLREKTMDANGVVSEEIAINYGNLLQVTLDFLIVAFIIFLVVKGINHMKKKEEVAPTVPPSQEIQLLTEIRDNLKKS
jgi:large conductance mechanosensitive channel